MTTSFIRRYPGTAITFNVVECKRMTKDNEEEVGDYWISDDESDECGVRIIARLIFTAEKGSSILVTYGARPIINAPLVMQASPPKGSELSIHFRDFALLADRAPGSQCVRRLFKLTFAQPFEAVAFQVCHDIFLNGMNDPRCNSTTDVALEDKASADHSEVEESTRTSDEDDAVGDDNNNDHTQLAAFNACDEHTQFDDVFENTQAFPLDESDSSFL